MNVRCFAVVLILLAPVQPANADTLPSGIRDSQKPDQQPPAPEESLRKITVPEGFKVTLFAGEPDVRQPISFAIGPRGRLWVAECYSHPDWRDDKVDRILIFEDTDNDGQFDRRKVFAENLSNLTSIELGLGGVWACCAPNLIFIPDRDQDDQPDGPAEIKLDGWNANRKTVKHNIFNALTWSPDGWLYGGHGILDNSLVGKPGAAAEERIKLNCCVWRYHPVRDEFEVVAHGTTNPWGIDFDEHGECFFTNCVIGHLWHLVPGAHYKRMYGKHFNPYVYELMDACSDHLHWAGEKWQDSRGGHGPHDSLGGGHAHVGAMIYLGDNWPDKYHGALFTHNLHGNRVNQERIRRKGSGYTATHEPDFLMGNDPWFRGMEMKYGPDGGVFLTDWTDFGECHDNDGVHRSSGRIYKVIHEGKPLSPIKNLLELDNRSLASMQSQTANQWIPRTCRNILISRQVAGSDVSDAIEELNHTVSRSNDAKNILPALWTLRALGAITPKENQPLLQHPSEHVRSWSIRWYAEDQEKYADFPLLNMARTEKSAFVRLQLAAALQKLPNEQRILLAEQLITRAEDATDPNIPKMLWYGIEPIFKADRVAFIRLAAKSKIPLVRKLIARRIAEN